MGKAKTKFETRTVTLDIKSPSAANTPDAFKKLVGEHHGLTLPRGRLGSETTQFRMGETAKDDKALGIIHDSTQYDSRMRACRWLSSIARAWLLQRYPGEEVEEVQALFDETSGEVWIAANADKHTKALAENKWARWLTDDAVKPPAYKATLPPPAPQKRKRDAEDEGTADPKDKKKEVKETAPFVERVYRHAGHIQEALEHGRERIKADIEKASKDAATMDETVDGNNTRTCKAASRSRFDDAEIDHFMKVLNPKKFIYPILAPRVKVHAETKLMMAWMQHHQKVKEKHTLWVAGVMRPCTACWIRLKRYSTELGDRHKLNFKDERNGPAWLTDSAFCGFVDKDYEELRQHLLLNKSFYLSSYPIGSDDVDYGGDSDSDTEKGKRDRYRPIKEDRATLRLERQKVIKDIKDDNIWPPPSKKKSKKKTVVPMDIDEEGDADTEGEDEAPAKKQKKTVAAKKKKTVVPMDIDDEDDPDSDYEDKSSAKKRRTVAAKTKRKTVTGRRKTK